MFTKWSSLFPCEFRLTLLLMNLATNRISIRNAVHHITNRSYALSLLSILTVPSSIQPIQNKTLTEGGSVTLSCNASGMPSPSVSWIKVSSGHRTNGTELVFTNINRSEAGEYRCEASNLCGNDAESVSVDVQCKYYIAFNRQSAKCS